MISLIKNAKKFGITYTANSLTVYDNHLPSYVFEDSTSKYFHASNSPTEQWWEISFSAPVLITKYTIKTGIGFGYKPKKWTVYYSYDYTTWIAAGTVSGKETGDNKDYFELNRTVRCTHFRIVVAETSTSNPGYFAFTYFDCIGKALYVGDRCTNNRINRNPISKAFIYSLFLILS